MNRSSGSSNRDDRNDSKPTSVAFTISLNDSDENDDDGGADNVFSTGGGGCNDVELAEDFGEKSVRVSSRKTYLDEKFAARGSTSSQNSRIDSQSTSGTNARNATATTSSRYVPTTTKNLKSTETSRLVTKMPRKSANSMTSSVYDRLEACKQRWRNEARKLNLDLSKKNTAYDSGSDKDLISFESPECDDNNADENGSATNSRSFMFHGIANDGIKSVVDERRQHHHQQQLSRNNKNSNNKGNTTISLIDKSIENDLNRLADYEEENGDEEGGGEDAGSDDRHSVCSNETYVYDSNKYTDEEKARLSIDDYFKTANTTAVNSTKSTISGSGPHNLPEMTFEEKTNRFFATYNTAATANNPNLASTRLEKRIRQLLESKKAAAIAAATATATAHRSHSNNDQKEPRVIDSDANRRKEFNYTKNLEPETDSDQDRMLEVAFSVPLKEINSKKSKVVVNVSQKKKTAVGSAQAATGAMSAKAENGCDVQTSDGRLRPDTITENCFRAEISLCGSAGSCSSQNLHNNSQCDTQSFLKQTRQFISALEAKLEKNEGRRKTQAYTDEEKLQSSNDLAAIRNNQRLFVKQTQRSTAMTSGNSALPSSKIPKAPVLRRTNQAFTSTNRMNDLARSSSYTMPAVGATSTPTAVRKSSTASATFRDRSLSRTNRFATSSPIQKSASARLVLSSATSSSSIDMENDGDEEYAALVGTKSAAGSTQLTQTRYNRAFALRRARLEVAEKTTTRSNTAPPLQAAIEQVPVATVAPIPSGRARLRQSLPSSKATQASPPPPIPRSTFLTARKSLPRLPHPTNQATSNTTTTFARQSSARSSLGSCSRNGVSGKGGVGVSSGSSIALSSSASRLSSKTKSSTIAATAPSSSRAQRKSTGRPTKAVKDPKIVEKQLGLERWNRRKSYNPLKAASEGRKRDFEKKCQQQQHGSDLMVRSCLDSIESRNDETDGRYVTNVIDTDNGTIGRGSNDSSSANDIRRSQSYGDSRTFYERKLIAEYVISSDSENDNYIEDDDSDTACDDNGIDADNFSKTVFIS